MNKKDDIRSLAHSQPFRPMVIHTADGRRFNVPHPDFLALGSPRSPFVFVVDENDILQAIAQDQITTVETPTLAA